MSARSILLVGGVERRPLDEVSLEVRAKPPTDPLSLVPRLHSPRPKARPTYRDLIPRARQKLVVARDSQRREEASKATHRCVLRSTSLIPMTDKPTTERYGFRPQDITIMVDSKGARRDLWPTENNIVRIVLIPVRHDLTSPSQRRELSRLTYDCALRTWLCN